MLDAEILFDSGASVSVISQELCKMDIGQSSGTVMGIGGQQKVGLPVVACICFPSEFKTEVTLKPIAIAGKNNLIILGRDFLTRFGITQFDWVNNRIKLGNDWVFFLDPLTLILRTRWESSILNMRNSCESCWSLIDQSLL